MCTDAIPANNKKEETISSQQEPRSTSNRNWWGFMKNSRESDYEVCKRRQNKSSRLFTKIKNLYMQRIRFLQKMKQKL